MTETLREEQVEDPVGRPKHRESKAPAARKRNAEAPLFYLGTENHFGLIVVGERSEVPEEPLGDELHPVEEAPQTTVGEEAEVHIIPLLEHGGVVVAQRFPHEATAEQDAQTGWQVEMVWETDDHPAVGPQDSAGLAC